MKFFYPEETGGYATIPSDAIAALAKSGVQTNENSENIPDIQLKAEPTENEKPAETPPVPSAPAAPTSSRPEPPAAETPSAPPPIVNWRDEMKKAQLHEVLKDLGFDEKMVGFANTWRSGGDVTSYLRAALMDYSKLAPEDLIRQQLAEEYPEFSPEDLAELYRAKVVDQYKLDPEVYSEQEVKRGKLLLTADAKKIREGLIQRQQDFIMNAKPPEMPDPMKDFEAQVKHQEVEREKALQQYKASFDAHQATKDLLTNKVLKIGDGEEVFNYEVSDPQKVLTILQDPIQWAQTVFNEDGTPQIEKQLAMSAVAIDHKGVFREIFKAGKAIGAKQALEQLENAKKPGAPAAAPEQPLTPAQALAKSGVLTFDNF